MLVSIMYRDVSAREKERRLKRTKYILHYSIISLNLILI